MPPEELARFNAVMAEFGCNPVLLVAEVLRLRATVERAWKFHDMMVDLSLQFDGSQNGARCALFAKELADCLDDQDTGALPLPTKFYE